MSLFPLTLMRRWLGNFWRFLDVGRRAVLNLVFLLFVVLLITIVFGGGIKPLEDKTVLVLDLKGHLVEQYPGGVRQTVLEEAQNQKIKSTQLRDVLMALDAARTDPKISSAALLLDDFQGAGLSSLREVAAALDRFKTSGKPVIAWGASYDQRQYFLAAHADEILMHPMGIVYLEGFGGYRNYYRDALDKLGITVNLMRVGTYKSFGEPFIANEPSPAATEAETSLYSALWNTYTGEVEQARKLPAGSLMRIIDDLPNLLTAADGDVGKVALTTKLVDGLKTRDELRQMLMARGAQDKQGKDFRQISFYEYLSHHKPKIWGDAVGVVIAAGDISDGDAGPGSVGGLSTAAMIRKAREDEHIKAIVLRVDSPGGSVFGSELIRHELEITRKAGKPVVVSMGDLAASGGYWISMASDEVIADAATITGSIGVFALLPTADKAMEKIGVHTAGVTTTWLGGGYDPRRPLDPRFGQLIQTSIDHIYSEFITKAAQARKTTPQKIDEVAQGRVWTGEQAKERGLIDRLGSYDDALQSAAKRANLGHDYRIAYIERDPSGFDRIFKLFDASLVHVLTAQLNQNVLPTGMLPNAATDMVSDMARLAAMADRHKAFTAVAHCFCGEP